MADGRQDTSHACHVLRYLERGLSRQHLREFETASLSAQVFRQALHTKSKEDRDSYINSILRGVVDPGR